MKASKQKCQRCEYTHDPGADCVAILRAEIADLKAKLRGARTHNKVLEQQARRHERRKAQTSGSRLSLVEEGLAFTQAEIKRLHLRFDETLEDGRDIPEQGDLDV